MKNAILRDLNDSGKLQKVLEIINTILRALASPTAKDDEFKPICTFAKNVLGETLPDTVGFFFLRFK